MLNTFCCACTRAVCHRKHCDYGSVHGQSCHKLKLYLLLAPCIIVSLAQVVHYALFQDLRFILCKLCWWHSQRLNNARLEFAHILQLM
eukprot:485880-Amphidinium_carterae.1